MFKKAVNPISQDRVYILRLLLLTIICLTFNNPSQAQDFNIIPISEKTKVIDAKIDDWGELRYYDHATRLKYGLSNDSEFVYMVFQSTNSLIQMKTIIAGMTIKLKTKQKPKVNGKLTFPKPRPEKSVNSLEKSIEGPSLELNKAKKDLRNTSYILKDFLYTNGDISISLDTNFMAFIDWDTAGLMTVELRIPLNELFGNEFQLSKISSKDIKMTLEINPLDRPNVNPQNRGRTNSQQPYSSNPMNTQGSMSPGNYSQQAVYYESSGPLFTAQRLVHPFKLNSFL